MDVRILGPFEISTTTSRIEKMPPRHQKIVAALALAAGRFVGFDTLVDAIWPAQPPATAREQVRNGLAAIQRQLTEAGADRPITIVRSGARLEPSVVVDLQQMEALSGEAASASDPAMATAYLRDALAIWRGSSLAGLQGAYFESEAARLDERRLALIEERIGRELAGEVAPETLSEVRALTDQHPWRERLTGQYMTLLYRDGRRKEALEAFTTFSDRVRTQLGLEPSPALAQLEIAILRADPSLDPPPTRARTAVNPTSAGLVPRQLPRRPQPFVGRTEELTALRTAITDGDGPVVVWHGPGGIGKSALALHCAHEVTAFFPDGQLYASLQGSDVSADPVSPYNILTRFLRAIGHPISDIPPSLDGASALWRSILATRRLLLLLDNVAGSAQIRPLLPAGGSSTVLVTSRRLLSSLDGASHRQIDLLPRPESVRLITQLAPPRTGLDSRTTDTIAAQCGDLPLALRLVSGRLAENPHVSGASLLAELQDTRQRLSALAADDLEIRTTFASAYLPFAPDSLVARLFRAVAGMPVHDVPREAAAAVLDIAVTDLDAAAVAGHQAGLLDNLSNGRILLHDLIRIYGAEESARTDTETIRTEWLTRTIDHYLRGVFIAGQLVRGVSTLANAVPSAGTYATDPTFDGPPEALDWLDRELPNILTLMTASESLDGGHDAFAITVQRLTRGTFFSSGRFTDAIAVGLLCARVATTLNRPDAVCDAYSTVAHAYLCLGDTEQAEVNARTSLAHAHIPHREAFSRNILGGILAECGRLDEAIDELTEALRLLRDDGRFDGLMYIQHNLGDILADAERYDEALPLLEECISMRETAQDMGGLALTLSALGYVYLQMDRHDLARKTLDRALGASRDAPQRVEEVHILIVFAELDMRTGLVTAALDHAGAAVSAAVALDHHALHVLGLRQLAKAHDQAGRPHAASEARRQALIIAAEHHPTFPRKLAAVADFEVQRIDHA